MYKKNKFILLTVLFTVLVFTITSMIKPVLVHANDNTSSANAENSSTESSNQYSTFNLADIDVAVRVPNDLVTFTQNVTSNNSYLEKIGAEDVEQLRALMKVNNVYLEIIPKDEVIYEILVSGKDAPNNYINFNEMDNNTLESQFQHYVDTLQMIVLLKPSPIHLLTR